MFSPVDYVCSAAVYPVRVRGRVRMVQSWAGVGETKRGEVGLKRSRADDDGRCGHDKLWLRYR